MARLRLGTEANQDQRGSAATFEVAKANVAFIEIPLARMREKVGHLSDRAGLKTPNRAIPMRTRREFVPRTQRYIVTN